MIEKGKLSREEFIKGLELSFHDMGNASMTRGLKKN